MDRRIITLTTDFGLRDPYVAEMKAVILKINPNVEIVDVSNQIEKFNVRMGAYVLASAVPYFPVGTIHVGVVDPGVGTERRPVLVRTSSGFFVGPDNGLFSLAVKKNGGRIEVHRITDRKLSRPAVSNTFHGRDIFAPAAAYLSKGTPLAEFGPRVAGIASSSFAGVIGKKDGLHGEVVHVDDFGNIVTNFEVKDLKRANIGGSMMVRVGSLRLLLKRGKTYGDVEEQKPLAVVGSHGFLEISVNQGNAAKTFRVGAGDHVVLSRP